MQSQTTIYRSSIHVVAIKIGDYREAESFNQESRNKVAINMTEFDRYNIAKAAKMRVSN